MWRERGAGARVRWHAGGIGRRSRTGRLRSVGEESVAGRCAETDDGRHRGWMRAMRQRFESHAGAALARGCATRLLVRVRGGCVSSGGRAC